MSVAALNWAFHLPLVGAAKSILIALADHADQDGGCWPSADRIALFAGVHRRTVVNVIRQLQTDGWLSVAQVAGRPNRYMLAVGKTGGDGPTPPVASGHGGDGPTPSPGMVLRHGGMASGHPNLQEPSVQPLSTIARRSDPKGERLPRNWQPPFEDAAYARERGLDPLRVAEDFRGYWLAKPGKEARKTDWSLTWQGWCRREADRRGCRLPVAGGARPKPIPVVS